MQSASAGEQLPPDVAQYVERRETCDHWRGEEGYDKARQAEINTALCESCSGSDAGLARLTKKYRANHRVLDRLADFEPKIEPATEAERKALCEGSPKQRRASRAGPGTK